MIPKLKTRVGKSEDLEESKGTSKQEDKPVSPSKAQEKKKKKK